MARVGIRDGFFDLGGNSIRAAILANQLRAALGDAIRVALLFEYPRVADLAAHLEATRPDAVAALAVSPAAGGDGPIRSAAQDEIADQVRDLSDDQVKTMLSDLLAPTKLDG